MTSIDGWTGCSPAALALTVACCDLSAVTLLPQTEWQAIPTDSAQDEDMEESDSDEPGPAIAEKRDSAESAVGTPTPSCPGAKSSSGVKTAADALERRLVLSDAKSRAAWRQEERQQVLTSGFSLHTNEHRFEDSQHFASDTNEHNEQNTRAGTEQKRMPNAAQALFVFWSVHATSNVRHSTDIVPSGAVL